MGMSFRSVNELEKAGTSGTSGTNEDNVLHINDLRCARNENVPGTSWHKLAQEVTGGEPQHREP